MGGSSTASSVSTGASGTVSASVPLTNPAQQVSASTSSAVQDNTNQTVTGAGTSEASTESHFPSTAVIGGICGAVAAVLLACALLWLRRRRYRRSVPRVEAFLADQDTGGHTPDSAAHSTRTAEASEVSSLYTSTPPSKGQFPYQQGLTQRPPSPTATMLPPYTPRDPPQMAQDSSTSLLTDNHPLNRTYY
jgi:hypothetical protein